MVSWLGRIEREPGGQVGLRLRALCHRCASVDGEMPCLLPSCLVGTIGSDFVMLKMATEHFSLAVGY